MAGADSSWLESLVDAVRRRLPIWQALLAVGAAAALLRMVPVVSWWALAYAELRLDIWWPLVFLVACVTFYQTGLRRYRRTGEPQFFPFSARFTSLVCLYLLASMLSFSSAHWGRFWCMAAVVCIAAAARQLALAVVAYGELWRTHCHAQVEETLRLRLDSGRLEEILRREAERGEWGSAHGLCLVHGHFESRKRRALSDATQKGIESERLERTVVAGDAYLAYLAVSWSETVLPAPARDWERLDASRELLTICLTALPEQCDHHRARIGRWMNALRAAPDPYFQFLLGCFVLGSCDAPDSGRVPEALPSARRLYASGPGDLKPPPGVHVDFRAIMQDTWLALAHHGIPPQAAFDLWMALRREHDQSPLLPRQSSQDWDASHGAARKFLAAHYADWAGNCAPGWGSGLAARREWNAAE